MFSVTVPHVQHRTARHSWPAKPTLPARKTSLRRSVRAELPEKLTEARKTRRAGLVASSALLVAALSSVPLLSLNVPVLPESLLLPLAYGFCGIAAFAAAAKAVLGQKLLVELHNGALYIQFDAPDANGPPLANGAVEYDVLQIRPASGKGNGAFATQVIPKGTYLGDYEGELLDEATYWKCYPTGVADYCIGIDRQWTIDAAKRAEDTEHFSACHINHSSKHSNVARRSSRAQRKVSFYAVRNIQEGEELLLDYGRLYWSGREDQVIEA